MKQHKEHMPKLIDVKQLLIKFIPQLKFEKVVDHKTVPVSLIYTHTHPSQPVEEPTTKDVHNTQTVKAKPPPVKMHAIAHRRRFLDR